MPIVSLLFRRYRVLLVWLCLSTFVDVFNVTTAININAPTVAGLVLLPRALRQVLGGRSSRAERLFLLQFMYLCLLGIVFGLLWPWEDPPGRPWNLQVRGRALLYIARSLATICVAIFIAERIAVEGSARRLQSNIAWGVVVAACAGVLSWLVNTEFSLFHLVSLGAITPAPYGTRVAGLNFEPRGLALASAHGAVVAALVWSRRRSVKWLLLVVICLAALGVSRSSSGLVALCVGASAAGIVDARARKWLLTPIAAGALGATAFFAVWGSAPIARGTVGRESWGVMLMERVGSTERYGSATSLFEEIVFRTEVFDAPAILFLRANVGYLLFGTGPGLVMFPASAFIPETIATAEYVETGLRSPPTMGLVLELANGGVVGLCLWVLSAWTSWRCLRHLAAAQRDLEAWDLSVPMFVSAAAIYLVATGYNSSFWALFMGMGFGAGRLIQRRSHAPVVAGV